MQPIKQKDDLLINEYQNLLLNFGIKLQPITKSILQQAAYLRATNNIKTPDAIHVATAREINCSIFLTNDLSLKKIPDLPIATLNEVH